MKEPAIVLDRGDNDLVFDTAGRTYIDLFTGNGAAWLGHGNAEVTAAVTRQLQRILITGGVPTPALEQARQAIGSFFPASHRLAMLYSTGMEAAEFAIRLCRTATGRTGIIGFDRSMHGKSFATAALGWRNNSGLTIDSIERMAYLPRVGEEELLARLDRRFGQEPPAAVFVEPLLGCGGGYAASDAFHLDLHRLCRRNRVLLVFDEILTGLYRTGRPFYHSALGFVPDVILLGKALGNGFPAAGVVARADLAAGEAALPGSTYSGNPLAASAVVATVNQLRRADIESKVAAIARTVQTELSPLRELGAGIRGLGAVWLLELPGRAVVEAVLEAAWGRGVLITGTGTFLRLLPPATIVPAHLDRACRIVAEEIRRAWPQD